MKKKTLCFNIIGAGRNLEGLKDNNNKKNVKV